MPELLDKLGFSLVSGSEIPETIAEALMAYHDSLFLLSVQVICMFFIICRWQEARQQWGPALAINLVPLSRAHFSTFILLYTSSLTELFGVKNYVDASYYL
jgi:hypothetical protein